MINGLLLPIFVSSYLGGIIYLQISQLMCDWRRIDVTLVISIENQFVGSGQLYNSNYDPVWKMIPSLTVFSLFLEGVFINPADSLLKKFWFEKSGYSECFLT